MSEICDYDAMMEAAAYYEAKEWNDAYEAGRRDGSMERWIPCSERLPEDKKAVYWACNDNGHQFECRWTNANHFWTEFTTDWHWNLFDVPQYSKVVAWMPLPEPYKEKDDETD